VEELLEMTGVAVLIYALLEQIAGVRVNLAARPEPSD